MLSPPYATPEDFVAALLAHEAAHDLSMKAIRASLQQAGQDTGWADASFPVGDKDTAQALSRWADQRMMAHLSVQKTEGLKTREKITLAVRTRLEVLAPHKPAMRHALAQKIKPARFGASLGALWHSADLIWVWAGDTATDYNRYTKRGLLAGVLASVTLYWLKDTSQRHQATWDMLDRQIARVLAVGGTVGKWVGKISSGTRRVAAIIFMCAALLPAVTHAQQATTPAQAPDWAVYGGYAGDTQTGLNQPHRSQTELGRWLSRTIGETLTMTPDETVTKLSAVRPLFTEKGYREFLGVLAQLPFAADLQKKILDIRTVVNGEPLLIGQGVSGGRYAWAFEMTTLVTAQAPGKPVPTTVPLILRIQLGRSAQGDAENGVLIEGVSQFVEAPSPQAADGGQPPATP